MGGNLDTLAAAYAESGKFAHVVMWQETAIDLTRKGPVQQQMLQHLELYKARKPYREDPKMQLPTAATK